MKRDEVALIIDVFTSSTLPMSRLADYLKAFSAMLGSEAHVHFERVKDGSAECLAYVEPHAVPKVKERVDGVAARNGPKVAMKAHAEIDDLLLEDNAIAHVAFNGRNVIEFPAECGRPRKQSAPLDATLPLRGRFS